MGLKDIPPSDSNAILCRYKPYFATKSNIVYSGLPSEHESSNFCQSPAPRRSTIHKFSLPRFLAIHLARQSPFHGTPGHIRSRDGLQEDHRPATHSREGPASPFPAIHLTRQSPFYEPPGHIRSRDGLQEDHRPATYSPQSPVPHFPAIHLTRQSPFYGPTGHIGSRDGLQEDHRPATHGRAGPAFPFPAIHLAPQSPFYGPLGHTRSRDGINLCPSSDPNPSRQHSRAYPLARWFAGGRIPSRNLRSRIRGVLQKSQALHLIKIRAGVCASHYALEGLRTLIFRIILY